MIEFKNRIVNYPNRKRLEVRGFEKDFNGDLKRLIVDVHRNEGDVIDEGTPLNAQELNQMFKSINIAIDYLFRQYYSTDDLTVSWVQQPGIYNEQEFKLNLKDGFHVKVTTHPQFLTAEVIEDLDSISVVIKETQALNNTIGTSTINISFFVELYANDMPDYYLTRLKGMVSYTNTSVAPLD